jgi:hypothetical protein
VPFGKKKNISDSQWQGAESSSSPRGGVGNASKMLPDINGQGKGGGVGGGNNGGNFSQQALSTLRDPSKINGKNGGGSVDYEGNVRQSPVPLLTLPGNLVTPASLISPAGPYSNISNNAQKNNDSKGGFHLPQISGRSDAQSARVGAGAENAYDYRSSGSTGGAPSFNQAQILPQQPAEKKKKAKAKNPKTHKKLITPTMTQAVAARSTRWRPRAERRGRARPLGRWRIGALPTRAGRRCPCSTAGEVRMFPCYSNSSFLRKRGHNWCIVVIFIIVATLD